jgi:hypothetical protein
MDEYQPPDPDLEYQKARRKSLTRTVFIGAAICCLGVLAMVPLLFRSAMNQAMISSSTASPLIALGQIHQAEMIFQTRDVGKNFWVGDVSGLYRLRDNSGATLALIDRRIAQADTKPLPPGLEAGGATLDAILFRQDHGGMLYRMVPQFEKPGGGTTSYSDGKNRSAKRFAVCAYPAVYSGGPTYLLNEEGKIWMQDTGGAPVLVFPQNPEQAGWKRAN